MAGIRCCDQIWGCRYMQTFAYKTLTSADFKAFYLKFFDGKGVDFGKIDWDGWFNGYGMPPVANTFDDSLVVVR